LENVLSHPQAPGSHRRGRSIAAVVAGLSTIIVTHTGTDAVLHETGVFPAAGQLMSDGLFGLAFAYRFAFSVLGAYVTARLAPARPRKHVLVLGGIGVVLSLGGLLATAGRGPEFGPLWYPLALLLVTLPCCLLGERLASRPGSHAA